MMHPFLWSQLRATGRARTPFVVALLFGGAVLLISSFVYYGTPRSDWGAVDTFWASMLTFAQVSFMLLFAPGAVRRMVLRDFQTGMIESHRLTPMSSTRVMIGYLIGPTAQAFLLYLVAAVLVTYFGLRITNMPRTGAMVGLPGLGTIAAGVLFGHICLLILSLLICSLTLLSALATGGKHNIVGLSIALVVFGGWMVVRVVPGLALVTGVMSGGIVTGFVKQGVTATEGATIITAAILQLCLALVFFRAAANKFRAPDGALFTLPLAAFLLLFSGLVLYAGYAFAPRHTWIFQDIGTEAEYRPIQLLCSLLAFSLISLFLTSAAVVEKFRADRSLYFGVRVNPIRRAIVIATPLLLAVATVALALAMRSKVISIQVLFTSPAIMLAVAVALICWYFTDFNVIYTRYSQGRKIFLPLLLLTLLIRGGPVLIDAAAQDLAMGQEGAWRPGWVTSISGAGTIVLAGTANTAPMWGGLAVQLLIAGVTYVWAQRGRRKVLEASRRTTGVASA